MPYKIPNTFQPNTPIGQSVSNLMSGFFGHLPTPMDEEKDQHMAAQTALEQQKLAAPGTLGDVVSKIMAAQQPQTTTVEGPRPTPGFIGPEPPVSTTKPGASYHDAMQQNWPALIRSLAENGAIGQAGGLARATTPWAPNATPHDMDMAMLGAGDSYGSTMGGTASNQANELTKVGMQQAGENKRAQMHIDAAPGLRAAGAKASATAKSGVAYDTQLRTNKEGAANTLSKTANLRKMVESLPDDAFGPIAGSAMNQAAAHVLRPKVQRARDDINSALSDMALDVAKMKLKGEGSVSDAERGLVNNTLAKMTTSKQAMLDVLSRLEGEANNVLSYNGTAIGATPPVRDLNTGQPMSSLSGMSDADLMALYDKTKAGQPNASQP